MGVVCKQPTTTCGKSNILTSKWANVGSSGFCCCCVVVTFESCETCYYYYTYEINSNAIAKPSKHKNNLFHCIHQHKYIPSHHKQDKLPVLDTEIKQYVFLTIYIHTYVTNYAAIQCIRRYNIIK